MALRAEVSPECSPITGELRSAHRITGWDPEDIPAWEAGNNNVAQRNLIWSTATTHVAFSVWSLWSVMVLFMPESVYGLTAGDKLLLAATATLVGGCVRIPYTMATARFGGRDWAAFSSAILLVPTVGTLLLMVNPGQPLWLYLVCAALTGLGGGNYSASLANVEMFYPQRRKGFALGVTGGIGNLGIAAAQFVGLVVLATVGDRRPYLVCAVYLVLLVVVGIGAALRMDNVEQHIDAATIRSILAVRDTWLLSLLYSAAFGSFIGFAFAFVQVLHTTFSDIDQTPAQSALHTAEIAFAGPLLAALARVYGGWLADRRGGGRVTLLAFVGMALATTALTITSWIEDHDADTSAVGVVCSISGFMVLFALAGIGNGSVLKLIPSVFEQRSRLLGRAEPERRAWATSRSGALIGFATAIGALGGVAIDLILRHAYLSSGTETPAFMTFLGGYIMVATLTWLAYVHPRSAASGDTKSVAAPVGEESTRRPIDSTMTTER